MFSLLEGVSTLSRARCCSGASFAIGGTQADAGAGAGALRGCHSSVSPNEEKRMAPRWPLALRASMRPLLAVLLVYLVAGCATPPASSGWQTQAPGLDYRRLTPLPNSVVHALRLDLHSAALQLTVSPPQERGLSLDQMPSSRGALAVVNGSFFDGQFTPRGLTVSDGVAWQPVLAAETSPLLACDAARRCVIELRPPTAPLPQWQQVLAGTPWLLDQGRQRSAADDATCASLCAAAHPRTAVGLDAAGLYLYLVTVEGRRSPVMGLSLAQLSAVMASLGAQQALNLDGGGSSSLLLNGEAVMARPLNEPRQRRVANALQIHRSAP